MIVSENVGNVDGMAIDYLKSRLYWLDVVNKTIESSTLNGADRRKFLQIDVRDEYYFISLYYKKNPYMCYREKEMRGLNSSCNKRMFHSAAESIEYRYFRKYALHPDGRERSDNEMSIVWRTKNMRGVKRRQE